MVRLGTRAMPLLSQGPRSSRSPLGPAWQAGDGPLGIAPKRRIEREPAAVPFIAPSEIRNTNLSAALRGYDREETDALLSKIEASYERVWLEREELRAQVLQLQEEVREHGKLRAQLERMPGVRRRTAASSSRKRWKRSNARPPHRQRRKESRRSCPFRLDTSRTSTSSSLWRASLQLFNGSAPTRGAIPPGSGTDRPSRSCSHADRSARRGRL
jgi:hypothetical protein